MHITNLIYTVDPQATLTNFNLLIANLQFKGTDHNVGTNRQYTIQQLAHIDRGVGYGEPMEHVRSTHEGIGYD